MYSRTDFFDITLGLRQVCVLSPMLFNIFINDLRNAIQSLNKGVKCGYIRVSMLAFADDLVILADSKKI